MNTTIFRALILFVIAMAATGPLVARANPWADVVISYTPGDPIGVGNPDPYQTDGTQTLGEPNRDTGFGSQVGIFYPAFMPDELTIIGAGGELVVKFNEPVVNDSSNPFGIDLLVFGNTFYAAQQQNPFTAGGAFSEPGNIAVSQDNVTWHKVPGVFADDLFPTLGYSDTTYNGGGNYGGTVPTDFTKPVDPSFHANGKTEAQINAAYDGSGGGTGVELSMVGLDWIQFVRVWQPKGAQKSTEIDAFADVQAIAGPPPSMTADFDNSSAVDGNDFLIWQRGYGMSSNAAHADGDANDDGAVDSFDLQQWSDQFGSIVSSGSAMSAAAAIVPEPTSCSLWLSAFLVLLFSMKERRVS